MKTSRTCILIAAASAAFLGVLVDASADEPRGYETFYNTLAPYGEWIEVPHYNWAWVPSDMPPGWRPYTRGHWVYTDDHGWTWVSNEPWGWATFHYGRWMYDDDYGWVWIPGDVWGPAWVSWRYGDDWIGWAPLSPDIEWGDRGIIHDHGDIDRDIDRFGWSFVHKRDFDDRDIGRVAELPARNVTLLGETHNVTDLEPEEGGVFNRSIAPSEIEHSIGRPIQHYRVTAAPSPGPVREEANELHIYRPAIRPAAGVRQPTPPAPPRRPEVTAPNAAELNQRHAMQLRNLELQHAQERSRLEQMQQEQRMRVPQGMAPDELRRNQEQERQAQMEQHRMETQQMFRSQQREMPRGPAMRGPAMRGPAERGPEMREGGREEQGERGRPR